MLTNRRLAAILFTDIVGYTAMMQKDEQLAVSIHKKYISVLKESVSSYDGEIVNDYGDGSLCVFSSTREAMSCAIQIQQELKNEPVVPLRIGLHIGEIFFEDGKVFGDGVNIASRIQSLGVGNSILFSSEICSKLKNQSEFKAVTLGHFNFKNVDEAVEVFALANEGFTIPHKKKIEGKLKEKEKSRKYIVWIPIAAALLGVIAFFLYSRFTDNTGFTGKEKSIAVLPFENISTNKDDEYINDGFTIDIINKLSKLSSLTSVPGWARVRIFKNTAESLTDVARELGVSAILTGTIQKQGERLHIITQLTDINSGKTIWNMDDDRTWGDVLTLQSEVAEKIAASLSAHLTQADKNDINKQYTGNPAAYEHYIKGRYFWDSRSTVSFDSAEANYKKAIELDPNYSLAYAGLADLFIFNRKGMSQLEAMPIARDYANKALSIDSTSPEALTTLGFIQSGFDYNWKVAKATLEKAIRLNPNYAYAHIFYGNLLQYTEENTDKGLEEIKKARDLDPLSVSINWILGRNYFLAGKNGLAEEQYKKTIGLNNNFSLAKAFLGWELLLQKRYDEAFTVIRELPQKGKAKTDIYRGPMLSFAYAVSGDIPKARAELEKGLKENTFGEHAIIAVTYTALHENAMALTELEMSLAEKEIFLYFVKVNPLFEPLRNEPRFKEILRKMNLD